MVSSFVSECLALAKTSTSCGSLGSTTTIRSQANALAISSCTVYQGSIAVATDVSIYIITFDGIRDILGNLVVEDIRGLTTLGGNDLQSINGNFTMFNDTLLSTLRFPNLISVGIISIVALPSIAAFEFTSGISSATGSLSAIRSCLH